MQHSLNNQIYDVALSHVQIVMLIAIHGCYHILTPTSMATSYYDVCPMTQPIQCLDQ